MRRIETSIPAVMAFEPTRHGDSRGYFMETWRKSDFENIEDSYEFVQDNQSKSVQGTLRGLHYQLQFPQGKLLRVISGEVFDVAVDLRRSSDYFGKSVSVVLSAANNKQLWVPPGFAHGFYVLSATAEIVYKCTDYYHPEDEHSLLWNDPALGIKWPQISPEPLLCVYVACGSPLAQASLFK